MDWEWNGRKEEAEIVPQYVLQMNALARHETAGAKTEIKPANPGDRCVSGGT